MNSEIERNDAMPEEAVAAVPQEVPAEPEVPVIPATPDEQKIPETPEADETPVVPAQEDPWAVFREDTGDQFPDPFAPKKKEARTPAAEAVNPSAANPAAAQAPQGAVPPQGYMPPYGYAPPQGYMPPYGYAPQQGYVPPYGYTPPQNSVPPQGYTPPQNPVPQSYQPYAPYAPAQETPKKGGAGQVLMWIAAILIETVIVCFAIYGVYALVTRGDANRQPGYGQGAQIPSMPDQNDDFNSSSSSNPSSDIGENPTGVQMGVVCGQMSAQYAEYYGLEAGLVVQSFADNSPAKAAGLQVDDVITSANGVRVKTFEELFAIMQKMKPGDEMKLECYRLVRSEENIWGFKASEPFTITFAMQANDGTTTSSTPSAPVYPGA